MTTTLETELRDLRRIAGIPAIAGVNVSASGIQALAHDGLRRVDRPDAIKAADRFHIGSNTKALTALVAASAVERGAISWNTTAAEVLRSGAPSLHQLLAHRSGLLPYREDDEIRAVEVPTARRPSSGLPSRAKYWPRSRCSRPIRGTCIRMPGLS